MTALKVVLPALSARLVLPRAATHLCSSRTFSTSSRLLIDSTTTPWASPLPSSSSTPLYQYLIVAKDHPQALQTRLSVRQEHLAAARQGLQNGRITMGGALLSQDHFEASEGGKDKANSIIGSMLVVQAESMQEARRQVEADIYNRSGVFSSIDVYPFVPASIGAAQAVAAEATAATEKVKEVADEAASSLGQLRETETNKWKEAASRTLEWLRKSQQGKQIG